MRSNKVNLPKHDGKWLDLLLDKKVISDTHGHWSHMFTHFPFYETLPLQNTAWNKIPCISKQKVKFVIATGEAIMRKLNIIAVNIKKASNLPSNVRPDDGSLQLYSTTNKGSLQSLQSKLF